MAIAIDMLGLVLVAVVTAQISDHIGLRPAKGVCGIYGFVCELRLGSE